MFSSFRTIRSSILALVALGPMPALADAIYSIKDAGIDNRSQAELGFLSGADLTRIDEAGNLSIENLRNYADREGATYSGPLPSGSGHIVFQPTYSDDGKYGVGTSLASPNPQAFWASFLIHDGKATFLTPGTPSTQPVYLNMAYAVNNSGSVAGLAVINGGHPYQAAIFKPDGSHTLFAGFGGLYTAALDINNLGQIVGQSNIASDPSSPAYRGFVSQGDKLVDLNTLIDPGAGWTILAASGINDRGQIAALGVDASGAKHNLVLTPTAVPEPSSLCVFGIVAVVLAGSARRRKAARLEASA